ncbi:hypothetical protein PSU4_60960 [Pseudonocardia sulfidoxydans NBRC 16205]|uniref:Uncharacterized protein n=1 Tax=Pseudonocardia sulfidoxydans NBRC 16205 TaxID=1223511 RepID=A0A511DQM3_9PSEU|nr:hypothetical protein [Pseudonocardia sulfidoxydans]GEL27142.1 hypothetical protein PSU4_60960 [Pseudonocardia sulfidoxydans NBRC 16205]
MSAPVTRSVRGAQVLITSAVDGLAHDIEESEVLVGHGRYVAMCGAVVLSASLAAPTGRVCRPCAALRCPDLSEEVGERRPARAARRAQSRWLAVCSVIMRGTLRHQAVA